MKEHSERLVQYLESNRTKFLKTWEEGIHIESSDPYKDKVRENGLEMYELIKRTIVHPLSENDITQLAFKVAKERIEAKINIGDFVYNVNLGRSILVNYINQSGIQINELKPIIDNINIQFDRFCYYAVTKYTEIKDREIQEKVLYINENHKDRLTLLGQMSSSFVHEFRNPLTSIMGFIKLLKSEYPDLKYLDTINYELDQLKFRITQFLHTSKMEVIETKEEEFSFKKLCNDILDFLYPSIVDLDVHIQTEIDPKIKFIGYKDEIKQVLLNILLNSMDALKQQEKPRNITVQCIEKTGIISITISNNGPTIPLGTMETIFEPFYTTKKLGTGIGLYVCKNIIEKHKGQIYCHSEDDLTTFSIDLPSSIRENSLSELV